VEEEGRGISKDLQFMALTAKINELGREHRLRNRVCMAHLVRVVGIR
jgi:hypothetical protein